MHATTNLAKLSNKATDKRALLAGSENGKFDEYGKCSEFTKFVTKQQGNINYKTIRPKWLNCQHQVRIYKQ